MDLRPELHSVLVALGASDAEIASLVSHYTGQLAAAHASVATIQGNIESLQIQLEEETARASRITAGIEKFVVSTKDGAE